MKRYTMMFHPRSFLAKVLIAVLLLFFAMAADKTYYDVLEVQQDASLKEIKTAYRRLALEHHPDRNKGHEKEAEVLFREISEAYEVLSDEKARQDYDFTLKHNGRQQHQHFHQHWQHHHAHRDPFAQFNDLFQNDEFFKEAFKGMDDLFTQMFPGGQNSKKGSTNSNGAGWAGNLLNKFASGLNVEVTTSSSFGGGSHTTSTRTTTHQSGGSGTSSYTSRSTQTVIENGKRVTIQSLEKDGNKIQEKYIGEQLIERLINGRPDEKLIEAGRGEF